MLGRAKELIDLLKEWKGFNMMWDAMHPEQRAELHVALRNFLNETMEGTLMRVYVRHDDVVAYCREHPDTSHEDAARALAKLAGMEWPGHAHFSPGMEGWCVSLRRDRFDRPHREGHA